MKGIVVNTDNTIEVKDFGKPLNEALGEIVGGYIETVHPCMLTSPYLMIVNEEGLLKDLPLNESGSTLYGTGIHGQPIVGNIVIMKEGPNEDGEWDIIGLDDYEVETIRATMQQIVDKLHVIDKLHVPAMQTFFYTYGYSHEFCGGWTEVEAPDRTTANRLFRVFHPDATPNILRCAFVYDEAEFTKTKMYKEGNFGKRCLEKISYWRKPLKGENEK